MMSELDPKLVAARLRVLQSLYVPATLSKPERSPPRALSREIVEQRLEELGALYTLCQWLDTATMADASASG